MKKVKVCVLGHFGFGKQLLNGQTIKTKVVTDELARQLGEKDVLRIDTHGGIKTLLKAPFHVLRALTSSRNVLMFPAHNGLRVYGPLLALLRPLFPKRRLHYVVIGGWLPEFLKARRLLTCLLKGFDKIYVETTTMKKAMEVLGFSNTVVMPNCKPLTPLKPEQLIYPAGEPYKLCTFSRVMKEKGIEDAVEAVKAVNGTLGRIVYELDIYGQVDPNQQAWFKELEAQFPAYIRYCGCVPADQSTQILKNYFALLFPTRFYTEGIPGTIIDAYAAGIPVISAKWESFADIIDDGKTGSGYEFENCRGLIGQLVHFAKQPDLLTSLKDICLHKAQVYQPQSVVLTLLKQMEG